MIFKCSTKLGRPNWGGWGGRYKLYKPAPVKGDPGFTGGVPYEPETREIWTDVEDEYTPFVANEYGRAFQRAKESIKSNKITMPHAIVRHGT